MSKPRWAAPNELRSPAPADIEKAVRDLLEDPAVQRALEAAAARGEKEIRVPLPWLDSSQAHSDLVIEVPKKR